jgi:hypothetical protein
MPRKNISFGITAFLDILGFGDRVLRSKKISEIDDIVAHVRKIQAEFDFAPSDDTVRQVHKYYKKTVLAFSDSVIVNVPLQSDMTEIQGTFDALMSEISGMAFAQGRCVTDGVFLRGGIDLGWWYRRGATLVSQSLTKAYKAEGRANVPVIALTNSLYKYLSKHTHRAFYAKDIDPILRSLRRYRADGPQGKVAFWYLDYISICAESIDWITSHKQHKSYLDATTPEEKQRIMDDGYRTNLEGWFSVHARNIEQAHKQARTDCVRAKYEWLAGYHNEIVPRYVSSSKCTCHLSVTARRSLRARSSMK